ncbi:membrane dipeptidase [Streptomyces sp. NPDC059262]|uniref:membrane dipeptidase n=1 Tax=Streptomyces sp. NPDC059262 TaxID=3346797 RepID=UPI0036BA47B7
MAGADHIGLGGDYDGADHQPTGLADVSGYPVLLRELADRGWSRPELEALTGRNVLRVLRESEERGRRTTVAHGPTAVRDRCHPDGVGPTCRPDGRRACSRWAAACGACPHRRCRSGRARRSRLPATRKVRPATSLPARWNGSCGPGWARGMASSRQVPLTLAGVDDVR